MKMVGRRGFELGLMLIKLLQHIGLLLLLLAATVQAGEIGFCYGRFADNLPTPQNVAQFLVSKSIRSIRIYDYDQTVLQSFSNTGIELLIGIPNSDLADLQTQQLADSWVSSYITPFYPATNITAISVGSEIITHFPSFAPSLLPAMQNLYTSLSKLNLASQITVSTANSMAILQNTFPPSAAAFNQSFATSFISPLLDYLKTIGSYVMVNVYPYFGYNSDPSTVQLDYALFQASEPVVDPNTNLQYTSLFDAQLDALYFALEGMGHPELTVVVTETGWPTKGDADEPGATVQNAATFNNNLVALVVKNAGTPHKPNQPVDVYIFSVYNEDLKTGPESERNWGVFYPNGSSIYVLDLMGTTTAAAPTSAPLPSNSSSTGTWCVAKSGAPDSSLLAGLNWACGQGNADCGLIQSGQACFQPDTLQNHASYAYNSYYQNSGDAAAACNFNGSAMVTTTDPSYGSCKFSGASGVLSPSSSNSPISSSSSTTSVTSAAVQHILPQWKLMIVLIVLLFTVV